MKTRATLFIYRDYTTSSKWWFWELVVPRMSPLSCDTAYRSCGEAEKAARRWAERHNMRVTKVVTE